jgi:hypothetical protein
MDAAIAAIRLRRTFKVSPLHGERCTSISSRIACPTAAIIAVYRSSLNTSGRPAASPAASHRAAKTTGVDE